jgi:small conductance mechanosensitive channel
LHPLAGTFLQANSTSVFTTQSSTSTTSTLTGILGYLAGSPLLTVIEVLVAVAGIAIAGTILSRLVGSLASRAGASKPVVSSIRQWIGVIMIILGVVAVASLTGLSSQLTTLTISGIAGLGVTLALQNTLSNVIAGVLLLQDGVIRIGDDVSFQGVRGEIVKLNLRTTWVKTQDGVIIVIGNSNLSAGPIVNYTASSRLTKKLEV